MGFLLHRVVGSRTVLQTVDEDTLRIGRGTGCDLRFEDAAVGLEHAVIRREGDPERSTYHLMDLGSVTGTYVDGEPVSTARLRDGSEISIGGYVLRVAHSDPEDPLFLHIRPADATPRPDARPLEAPSVDYAGAYRLRRGLLNKGFLGLSLAILAAVAVAAVPAARRLEVFRPGELASFHADRIEAAACSDCHVPWRGVSDARCNACHGPEALDHAPAHHPDALAALGGLPPCTRCHVEHTGREDLTPAGDAACVECHRDLPLSADIEPLFATRITAFGSDHPELHVTVPGEAGSGLRSSPFRRLPVTDPEARRADPTRLRLNHAKHLEPGLTSPEGRVQLACRDCHAPAGEELAPVSFEAHCARCHALTFDDRYPDTEAPHEGPEALAAFLYRLYLEEDRGPGSVREDLIRRLVRGSDPPPGLTERAAAEEVRRAELRLYENACVTCHVMDLEAEPRPTVASPDVPATWLPYARFPHGDHLELPGVTCDGCHREARSSTETADLLLPGIASCTPCHRAGAQDEPTEASAGSRVTPGPSGCRTCHDHHSGSRFPPGGAENGPLTARSVRAPESANLLETLAFERPPAPFPPSPGGHAERSRARGADEKGALR